MRLLLRKGIYLMTQTDWALVRRGRESLRSIDSCSNKLSHEKIEDAKSAQRPS